MNANKLLKSATMNNNNNEYINNLKKLDFTTEDSDNSSVFLVSQLQTYLKNKEISLHIVMALEKAKSFEADAVYFRFFDDKRHPLAQIYIYDNITKQKDSNYYKDKHRAIWSGSEIPIFMIVDKTTIKVFDCRVPIKIKNNDEISNSIDIVDLDNVMQSYNAQNFNNGSFWERDDKKNNFKATKMASERLINGLKEIRKKFHQMNLISRSLADRILIICILIKYLEENGIDKETQKNLAVSFFEKKTGYGKLEDIIKNKKLPLLLSALTQHFNGGIFTLNDEEIKELKKADISGISSFFEANYKNDLFGWREYSFEYIPIELISNFYEIFIPKVEQDIDNINKKNTGAIYTPSFLVNLLIDEQLPLSVDTLDEDTKLIDPACGSGIFLVVAYKRLVQRWRIKNIKNGKLADTNPNVLKKILEKNVFGVDINPISIELTSFSLQLALCSMLTPKQIWTELDRFSNLCENGNVSNKDFFEYLLDTKIANNFDFIIGNPPFVQKKLAGKSYAYYKELLENKYPATFNNPQQEFAFLFLEKSMHLLKKNTGKLCLILPAAHFLYAENSIDVRKSVFSMYNVSQIIDFTFLRRVLFPTTVVVMALFAECRQPTDAPIQHITAKRTKSSKERLYFEFDHYDFYQVHKKSLMDTINIWKCNLLGGLRVYDIVEKLNKQKVKLKDFYKSNNIKTYNSVKKDSFLANTNSWKLPLFSNNVSTQNSNKSYWGIRKLITKGHFPTDIIMKDFKDRIKTEGIGFSGQKKDIDHLKKYFKNNADLMCFYIATTSNRLWVRGPYIIYKSDFEYFPFTNDLKHHLSDTEYIILKDIVKNALDE
ncbi:MAG: N-6 DNA methylase [Elusimicrobiota bacterium]|jgi:SAM-dependent methyltransferase|nr:N-6 DNA methylase [Elusimicrobiota bacterium]